MFLSILQDHHRESGSWIFYNKSLMFKTAGWVGWVLSTILIHEFLSSVLSDLDATEFGECYKLYRKPSVDHILSKEWRVFFLSLSDLDATDFGECYTLYRKPSVDHILSKEWRVFFLFLSFYTKYKREPSADSFLSRKRRVFFLFSI